MPEAPAVRPRVGRPPGPAPDRDARRVELVDGAIRAIRKVGATASMNELAAEAGLTKPIIYTYFRGKAGLAEAIAERVTGEILERVTAARPDAGADLRELIRSTIDTFTEFVDAETELYRFLLWGSPGAEIGSYSQRLVLEVGGWISATIKDHRTLTTAEKRRADTWGLALVGAVAMGAEVWLVTGRRNRSELVDSLTDLIWSGMGALGTTK